MSPKATAALAPPRQGATAQVFQLRAQIFRQLQPVVNRVFSDSLKIFVQLHLPAIGQVESSNRL